MQAIFGLFLRTDWVALWVGALQRRDRGGHKHPLDGEENRAAESGCPKGAL
jgi:hypothetical protein